MTDHAIHSDHPHVHGPGCGHTAVEHGDHVDYVHDGHLHHPHNDHVDEHVVEIDAEHSDAHTTPAGGHSTDHAHGQGCGHETVPHGDHIDYLVAGRLHHPHEDHCDDHGVMPIVNR
jgi:hypothetical protein